jgi:preprotein translocase SecE subunit
MAVVTKPTPETVVRDPVKQLALGSFAGALYVLLSLGLILGQLPILWDLLGIRNQFLSEALLLIVTLGVAVGLFFLGRWLEGPHPPPGLRAGIGVAAVGLFLTFLISLGLGNKLAAGGEQGLGLALTVVVAAVLIAGLAWMFLQPGLRPRLLRLEGQGWFHAGQFKPTQGVLVRRATLFGLLVLIASGVYTLYNHRTLSPGSWVIDLPGTDYALYLMFHVNITLGMLVLPAILVWVAWRVVNWPVFADFLVATEAELNKVSWTTRKRLVQDTIVVLVTVFLMAVFLFAVDVLWIRILNNSWVRVLQVDLSAERKQQGPQEW